MVKRLAVLAVTRNCGFDLGFFILQDLTKLVRSSGADVNLDIHSSDISAELIRSSRIRKVIPVTDGSGYRKCKAYSSCRRQEKSSDL